MSRNLNIIYFGSLSLNLLSYFLNLHWLNTAVAVFCILLLVLNVVNLRPKSILLYHVLSFSIILTIVSSFMREYHGFVPALPIFADLFCCLILMAFFLKLRTQKSSVGQKDWKQVLIIFGIGFLFIFIAFDSISIDYQILIMLRMLVFAMMIFYGLFRPYVHSFVSYGIIINIFTTFISAITIFVSPKMIPYEFQTIFYLIGIYFLIVGILKSEKIKVPLAISS